jgi:hypothetical protein
MDFINTLKAIASADANRRQGPCSLDQPRDHVVSCSEPRCTRAATATSTGTPYCVKHSPCRCARCEARREGGAP